MTYEMQSEMLSEPMFGVVVKLLVQGWVYQVKCGDTYWTAMPENNEKQVLEVGQAVLATARRGIKLLITPLD